MPWADFFSLVGQFLIGSLAIIIVIAIIVWLVGVFFVGYKK